MAKRAPPPLPPRQNSSVLTVHEEPSPIFEEPPPSYDSIAGDDMSTESAWAGQDQRSTSMESLVPAESNQQNERRKLLLVYIHGFMGNETSFRSFPAHVHNLLTTLLAESHVVHTKIYPRYRSRRNITFARDDFSKWLEPHEDPTTDTVLLGHSMGGLLAAEVAIVPPAPPASRPLKHRILGTINFDVPYLGMHPGIIQSGLASLFSPAEAPGDVYSSELTPAGSNVSASSSSASFPTPPHRRSDGLWTPAVGDPNYDPSFTNDVVLPVRKGWRNAWHFINKHSGDLGNATKQLITSHMEFGGAMADYNGLKTRYAKIRALEEEDDAVRKSVVASNVAPARVRFINYYTASTGRPKKPKAARDQLVREANESKTSLEAPSTLDPSRQGSGSESFAATTTSTPSPRVSVEEYQNDGSKAKDQTSQEEEEAHDGEDWEDAAETLTIGEPEPMTHHEPMPIESDDEAISESSPAPLSPMRTPTVSSPAALSPASTIPPETALSHTSTLSLSASLPPIPELPPAPPPLNVSYIEDPATRKLVEKEHSRAVKAHEKAVKDRDKAVADREKLLAKIDRDAAKKEVEKAKKDAEKARKEAEKARKEALKAEQQAAKRAKDAEKQLTQSQKEELRLANEKQRMEAEARRMRGEKEPVKEEDDNDDVPDPPEEELSHEHIPDPPEERLSSRHTPDPPEQSLSTVTTQQSSRSTSSKTKEKDKGPPKDRMFCILPPKDSNGQRDPCWVRVFMKNVDEVGAHCGLFFVDERYERLVGDVAERIEGWVNEEKGQRVANGKEWCVDDRSTERSQARSDTQIASMRFH